jgi:hypothetical protein
MQLILGCREQFQTFCRDHEEEDDDNEPRVRALEEGLHGESFLVVSTSV